MRAHGSQNFHEPVKSTGQGFSFVLIKNNSDKKTAFFFLRERCTPLKTAFNWGGYISNCYFELLVNVFLRVVAGLGQKR